MVWAKSLGIDEDAQDVFFLQNQAIIVFNLDSGSGILVEQDLVADFQDADVFSDTFNSSPLGFFPGGVRHVNAAGRAFEFFRIRHKDTVAKGKNPLAAVPVVVSFSAVPVVVSFSFVCVVM